jgi:hypothetical protein
VTSAGWKHGQGLRVMVGWAELEAAEKPALLRKLEPILGSGLSAGRALVVSTREATHQISVPAAAWFGFEL